MQPLIPLIFVNIRLLNRLFWSILNSPPKRDCHFWLRVHHPNSLHLKSADDLWKIHGYWVMSMNIARVYWKKELFSGDGSWIWLVEPGMGPKYPSPNLEALPERLTHRFWPIGSDPHHCGFSAVQCGFCEFSIYCATLWRSVWEQSMHCCCLLLFLCGRQCWVCFSSFDEYLI